LLSDGQAASHESCELEASTSPLFKDLTHMNLTLWIPAMLFLGLAVLAAMFAFVKACDKV